MLVGRRQDIYQQHCISRGSANFYVHAKPTRASMMVLYVLLNLYLASAGHARA